jgi:hypothetical protein
MIKDVENFGILTTEGEKQIRIDLCNSCEKNMLNNSVPTCDMCACPIEYVTTYKFKICPLNKWGVD